jgi:hypothetical protein
LLPFQGLFHGQVIRFARLESVGGENPVLIGINAHSSPGTGRGIHGFNLDVHIRDWAVERIQNPPGNAILGSKVLGISRIGAWMFIDRFKPRRQLAIPALGA